jgi:hypothetical protein
MDRLKGIRLKIERAKKHIIDLDAAIHTFYNSEPYTLDANEKPEISHLALYVSRVKPVPDVIGAIIGDSVHNLRSALDHLMWQLVEAGGGTPDRHTYFPISENDSVKGLQQYNSAIGHGEIGKMPVGAEKVLRAVQPYVTEDSTLWYIHELDRIDKHRFVLTITLNTTAWGIDIRGRPFIFPLALARRPLVDGYEVVRMPISTYERTGKHNIKLGLTIAFGESEIVAGEPVLETLNHMADFVSALISEFEPFLS